MSLMFTVAGAPTLASASGDDGHIAGQAKMRLADMQDTAGADAAAPKSPIRRSPTIDMIAQSSKQDLSDVSEPAHEFEDTQIDRTPARHTRSVAAPSPPSAATVVELDTPTPCKKFMRKTSPAPKASQAAPLRCTPGRKSAAPASVGNHGNNNIARQLFMNGARSTPRLRQAPKPDGYWKLPVYIVLSCVHSGYVFRGPFILGTS